MEDKASTDFSFASMFAEMWRSIISLNIKFLNENKCQCQYTM